MTVLVSKYGEVIGHIFGNDEMIKLNTPEGCIALDDPPFPNMFFQKGKWVSIPTQPSPYHIFNYETKKWVDNRSLEDVKKHKWEHIKQQRDQFEYGGFEFDGGIYDSDQVSQGRIMGAAVAGVDQIWTLADNTTIDLSASQLQQLYAALQAHIANAHERGRIARQKIEAALTYEEIEAVNF
ncbi:MULTISPECIES: DUF4376 domain-containing protein [Acinetobacter calcoaceticus/baumannii complex]|uniref:DUF4376 domain-containing protein n=2 Tax=Acinetobacter TaxID=469 RepID=UPI000445A23B|nr:MULTISPECIES: DUF4376 domain-containing protein [Acinetobacter calcoaceticus/baumannii complex]MDB0280431.1 DUF4376 domain-containing protein [Acinetobacter seifertii]MDR0067117.1 DUF4376 domain-containing protein [Acinetobacter sp. 11520]EXI11603.1 hypothetical protein J610_4024 [Acinetobacter sp. 723929]EXI12593.1 hypothetical protein J610_3934 [Acinetobacter sp. 723929]KQE82824.1 hypothetical protein APB92_15520 [Acinetobacter pittii]